ncbi:hypothetical protein BDV96DRAFT_580859 [Lophiotrema nucula]|uniref:Probable double zinc ribbon domain-containing protein n=1 Tax=Lophiotrema nucula TaxID=690887 RepID=A0A6A5YZB4_9PLEO|nr:hypothetical protein BDV96DRAFT_580859 [Lophiotrema nucula]
MHGADGVVCSSCGLSHARNTSGKGPLWLDKCVCGAQRDAKWTFFKLGSNEDYRFGNPDAIFLKEFERRKGFPIVVDRTYAEDIGVEEGEITIGLQVEVPQSMPPPVPERNPQRVGHTTHADAVSTFTQMPTKKRPVLHANNPSEVSTFTQMPSKRASTDTESSNDSGYHSLSSTASTTPTTPLTPEEQRLAFANRSYQHPEARRWPASPVSSTSQQQQAYKPAVNMWRGYGEHHENSFARRQRYRERAGTYKVPAYDVHPALPPRY